MSNRAGRFVWYELLTSDLKAAEAFYTSVVGWRMNDSGIPGMQYTLIFVGDSMMGGAMALTDEMRAMEVPPCWSGYIGVDDLDAALEKVVALGGAIRRPKMVVPGGHFAVVADPHGGAFFLHQSHDDAPLGTPGAPGTVCWHELYAGDLASAWEFYSALFGWQKFEAIDMGPMGTYQTFGPAGGQAFGGMMTKSPHVPVACWNYYIVTDDIDAAATRVTEGGGKIFNGPMQVPGGGWVLNAADPQGAMFALLGQRK